MNNTRGFTLIELIIVVVIIAILSTLGLNSYNRIQDQSRAAKIVNDLQVIEKAWKSWKSSTNSHRYPSEDNSTIIPGGNDNDEMIAAGCPSIDEPEMSKTPINTSTVGYLESVLRDPWGRQYAYDYDLDVFPTNGASAGVNIMIAYCGADEVTRYNRIIPIIDEMIDKGDGNATSGKFFYDGATELWINISRDGT